MYTYIRIHTHIVLQSFVERYGEVERTDQVLSLREELRPYMLRRHKEDVEKSVNAYVYMYACMHVCLRIATVHAPQAHKEDVEKSINVYVCMYACIRVCMCA
jgi:hypothetical protein